MLIQGQKTEAKKTEKGSPMHHLEKMISEARAKKMEEQKTGKRSPLNNIEKVVREVAKTIPDKKKAESIKGKSILSLVEEAQAKNPAKVKEQPKGLQGMIEQETKNHEFRTGLKDAYKKAEEKHPDLFTGKIVGGLPVLKPEFEKILEDFLAPGFQNTKDGMMHPLLSAPQDITRLLDDLADVAKLQFAAKQAQ